MLSRGFLIAGILVSLLIAIAALWSFQIPPAAPTQASQTATNEPATAIATPLFTPQPTGPTAIQKPVATLAPTVSATQKPAATTAPTSRPAATTAPTSPPIAPTAAVLESPTAPPPPIPTSVPIPAALPATAGSANDWTGIMLFVALLSIMAGISLVRLH